MQLSAPLRDSYRTGLRTSAMRHCAVYPKLFAPITASHYQIPTRVAARWKGLGREVIRTARAVLSELQLSREHWSNIIPVIKSALNNTCSRHRNNYASLTALTRLRFTPPIQKFIRSGVGSSVSISNIVQQRYTAVDDLQRAVLDMHPVIANTLETHWKRFRDAIERGQLANFLSKTSS